MIIGRCLGAVDPEPILNIAVFEAAPKPWAGAGAPKAGVGLFAVKFKFGVVELCEKLNPDDLGCVLAAPN